MSSAKNCHRLLFPDWLRVAALLCAAGLVASCANYEGAYSSYEAKVVANPSEDAILGMWHRNAVDFPANTSWDVLFKSGGQGIAYYYSDDILELGNGEREDAFTWSYQGNGVWSVKGLWQIASGEARLAGDVILFKGTSLFGPIRQVYHKVEQ